MGTLRQTQSIPLSAKYLVPRIAANFTDGFRTQVPSCGNTCCSSDGVIDSCKESVRRLLDLAKSLRRQAGLDAYFPLLPYHREFSAEGFNSVVYVENILGTVSRVALLVDEHLLHQIARRVGTLNAPGLGGWITRRQADLNRPGSLQQKIDVPEFLGRHTGDGHGGVPLPIALIYAAFQGRQELRIEAGLSLDQVVMRCRWPRLSAHLLLKAVRDQTIVDVLSRNRQLRRDGNVRVEGSKRLVFQRLRQRMQPIEAVRPAADQHDLVESRIQRLDQPCEVFTVSIPCHYGLSLKIAASARRRISSACAAPRAGCADTSSHT
jgi:hypothetical protein